LLFDHWILAVEEAGQIMSYFTGCRII
jgi:hypothetical protein